mmetsp:Transcript_84944/g.155818  ORF Transcript_84944/g.155818 Transcript_84944/m.155818 type:complete len:85 (-) Transcript_84944:520-774(-)
MFNPDNTPPKLNFSTGKYVPPSIRVLSSPSCDITHKGTMTVTRMLAQFNQIKDFHFPSLRALPIKGNVKRQPINVHTGRHQWTS